MKMFNREKKVELDDLISTLKYSISSLIDNKISEKTSDCYWGGQAYESERKLEKSITELVEFCLSQKKE
jgi:hypothetical protein